MLKKLLRHLGLAALFFALTLAQQYLFYYQKGFPIVWLTLGKYLGVFAFFLTATLIRPSFLRYFFLSFVFLLNFFQMAHLSYFGTQILPNELYLLFSEFAEIKDVLVVEVLHVLFPLLYTLIPAGIGLLVFRRSQDLYGSKWVGILFCLYFVYNPARTFVTGNTWGRQPSTRELSGMNVYLSFSYFTGRILPHKLMKDSAASGENSSSRLLLTDAGKSRWDHVVFVLGESLSPYHMGLFGYERETTPFLSSMKENKNFFHTIGLSGGVSTDISVAFLINMGFGEAGSAKTAKGQHCLFKLAKDKQFTTHFLSSQSEEQLRYIAPYVCAAAMDDYRSLEDISPSTPDHLAADDKVLLSELRKLLGAPGRQFIMLHQRGSHGPWAKRSLEKNRKFPHDHKVNHYDNSVVEFDLFFKELSEVVKSSGKKTLVLYVSDHGEALGQNGRWGHGSLMTPAFEVPVLIMSFGADLPQETRLIPKFAPHYNISLFLAQELGWKTDQSFSQYPQDYVIFGNDIDGFAGKARVSFQRDGSYQFKIVE